MMMGLVFQDLLAASMAPVRGGVLGREYQVCWSEFDTKPVGQQHGWQALPEGAVALDVRIPLEKRKTKHVLLRFCMPKAVMQDWFTPGGKDSAPVIKRGLYEKGDFIPCPLQLTRTLRP